MDTDLIILGGGPAGLSAGIYAAHSRVPVILIQKEFPAGQMATTDIDNYPGFTETVLAMNPLRRWKNRVEGLA